MSHKRSAYLVKLLDDDLAVIVFALNLDLLDDINDGIDLLVEGYAQNKIVSLLEQVVHAELERIQAKGNGRMFDSILDNGMALNIPYCFICTAVLLRRFDYL